MRGQELGRSSVHSVRVGLQSGPTSVVKATHAQAIRTWAKWIIVTMTSLRWPLGYLAQVLSSKYHADVKAIMDNEEIWGKDTLPFFKQRCLRLLGKPNGTG